MLLHSGHITACYSRHDSDIHLIHRRLELKSDRREKNSHHPLCTAHLHPFCVVSLSCRFRVAWNLAKNVLSSRMQDKATFYSPVEAGQCRRPLRNYQKSVMRKKRDLSSHEMDTMKRSRHPTVVTTSNGEVQTFEEVQIYVHDLALFVTVNLLDETPAVSARKALPGPRIFLRLGQRSRSTVVQERDDNYMQDRQSRTSCSSRIVSQFRKQYVMNIAITGSVFTRAS